MTELIHVEGKVSWKGAVQEYFSVSFIECVLQWIDSIRRHLITGTRDLFQNSRKYLLTCSRYCLLRYKCISRAFAEGLARHGKKREVKAVIHKLQELHNFKHAKKEKYFLSRCWKFDVSSQCYW